MKQPRAVFLFGKFKLLHNCVFKCVCLQTYPTPSYQVSAAFEARNIPQSVNFFPRLLRGATQVLIFIRSTRTARIRVHVQHTLVSRKPAVARTNFTSKCKKKNCSSYIREHVVVPLNVFTRRISDDSWNSSLPHQISCININNVLRSPYNHCTQHDNFEGFQEHLSDPRNQPKTSLPQLCGSSKQNE